MKKKNNENIIEAYKKYDSLIWDDISKTAIANDFLPSCTRGPIGSHRRNFFKAKGILVLRT